MSANIHFTDNTNSLDIDFVKLRDWIVSAASEEGYFVGELGFVFCDDNFLHKINVDFLEHDTFTDIITFDYGDETFIAGEIYISIERVLENTKLYHQKFFTEIHRIIIHGVLHLLGYMDKNSEDKIQMTLKEDYYLSLLPYSK